jgi:hypothetical protein
MHTMSFRVPAGLSESIVQDLLRSSIAGGHDRAPTPTHCELHDNYLVLGREMNESGPVNVPWEVPGMGRLNTPTTTLMFRERPYDLVVELARGKINQVRNQYADWLGGGLLPCPEVEAHLARATLAFCNALMEGPTAAADQHADAALAASFEAADALVLKYQDQVFRIRRQRQPKLDTGLGCRISAVPPAGLDDVFRLSFNAACIPLTWRSIEPTESDYRWADADAAIAWANDRNLRVFAGPLVDFSTGGLPDYVRRLGDDPVALKSLMCDYVETVVARYRGKVTKWLVTAGANGPTDVAISEEDLIRLTATAADAAWGIDSGLQQTFGISQPWGDYLAGGGYEYSPFVYADTLLRAGLPFAGIELEWHFGAGARGSFCRDVLEASRLLDLYGLLGVPVHVSLGYPSSAALDAKADSGRSPEAAGRWRDFSLSAQAEWADVFAGLATCKSYVSSVVWDHLLDADVHRLPNAGLVDGTGAIKPAFDRLRALRQDYLR